MSELEIILEIFHAYSCIKFNNINIVRTDSHGFLELHAPDWHNSHQTNLELFLQPNWVEEVYKKGIAVSRLHINALKKGEHPAILTLQVSDVSKTCRLEDVYSVKAIFLDNLQTKVRRLSRRIPILSRHVIKRGSNIIAADSKDEAELAIDDEIIRALTRGESIL